MGRIAELKEALPRRDDFDSLPIKAPRVFKEINETFGEDTYFVTAIGLYQIWSGQFQKAHKPRHYQVCGQAGPLGWEIPAAIGVKKARPEAEVVGVVGDYSFQFLVEELAVAAQYDVGFVLIMLNNEYLGLIRQAETGLRHELRGRHPLRLERHGQRQDHGGLRLLGHPRARAGRDPDVAGVGPQGGRARPAARSWWRS